ncbi:MAG: MaoC family dehydratase [Phyllobacterium sp.]
MTSFIEKEIGSEQTIGSYTFTADEIIQFARRYDPQRFHVDADAASRSNFGALCASGWHTVSIWMKLNVQSLSTATQNAATRNEVLPVFGPSPGFDNMKWLKPVFPGDTLRYTRTLQEIRALNSRPGWSMMSLRCAAYNESGECVMEFDSKAMIKLPQ